MLYQEDVPMKRINADYIAEEVMEINHSKTTSGDTHHLRNHC